MVPGASLDPLEVASVLRHNERKYAGRFAPLPRTTGYLTAVLRQPDVLVGAYRDRDTGALEAFFSVLDHPRWPISWQWSTVPSTRPDRPSLYLHLYHLLVVHGIDGGKDGLILGRGKPELKRSLGADLVPQYAAAIR
jgi:hypothetical protein